MSCKVHLSSSGSYSPGDHIDGKVVCRFQNEHDLKGIICQLLIKELTSWTDNYHGASTKFTGENTSVIKSYSFGPEFGTIHPGVYEYPFSFYLPTSDIPSSYLHSYGSVQYWISASVQKLSSVESEDEVSLQVRAPINFNDRSRIPVMTRNEEEEDCYCCFLTAPTSLWATLEKNTFLLGEKMKVRVDLDNRSRTEITDVKVQLLSNVQYITRKPQTRYKYTTQLIAKASDIGVQGRCEKTYNFKLQIPETVFVPNFQGCSLFRHWCSLKVEAIFRSSHETIETNINDLKLGHTSPSYLRNPEPIGFSNIVPSPRSTSEIEFGGRVIPVARAPLGVYPPRTSTPPYPLGNPIGQPLHPRSSRVSTTSSNRYISNTASPVPAASSSYNPSSRLLLAVNGYPPPSSPSLSNELRSNNTQSVDLANYNSRTTRTGYPPPPITFASDRLGTGSTSISFVPIGAVSGGQNTNGSWFRIMPETGYTPLRPRTMPSAISPSDVDDFHLNERGQSEAPPPSYDEVMRQPRTSIATHRTGEGS